MTFYRRDLPHLQRDNKRHFITFNTKYRWTLPPEARDIILACCTHDHDLRIDLDAATVMPDHVHLIFTPLINEEEAETWSLAKIMDAIKGASAHLVNRALKRHGSVWQDESFDHVLRSTEDVTQKVRYVLDNPVRAGLVQHAADYRWSWSKPELLDVGTRIK